VVTKTFNSFDDPTSITATRGSNVLWENSNTFDQDGNVIRIITTAGAAENRQDDGLDRLSGFISTNGSTTALTLDPAGNRLKLVNPQGTTFSTYNALGWLTAAGSRAYTNDNNGNVLSNGILTFSYDATGALSGAAGPFGTSSYSRNGDGTLISEVTPRGTYIFQKRDFFDWLEDGEPWASPRIDFHIEVGPDGSIDTLRLGGTPFFSTNTTTGLTTYTVPDIFGNNALVTDPSGKVLGLNSFDAFGNRTNPFNVLGNKDKDDALGFQRDPGTGLLFTVNSLYDPKTARTNNNQCTIDDLIIGDAQLLTAAIADPKYRGYWIRAFQPVRLIPCSENTR
jgi:hypothetical protein